MAATANIVMETESLSDNQTKVSWSNAGTLRYPINIMVPMMEKMVPKEMDASLSTLKNILENDSPLLKFTIPFFFRELFFPPDILNYTQIQPILTSYRLYSSINKQKYLC